VLFFAEGTFTRDEGLLPFRLGAFTVAAQAGVLVTPVTIRGSRTLLRDENWLPRRSRVRIEISPPLYPDGSDFAAAIRLRDAARAEVLKHCDEPDRAHLHVIFTESGIESVKMGDL
jgi:1-acyl-sn-glycerol-3-phosphate acyltransferase